tara:strand:+ start:159 stop:587 length:429 start_codon:yes stop_codon:yes gene_type:complete
MNKEKVIKLLSDIYTLELNGIIRYTHYSLMLLGPNRIPLVTFFKQQATESLAHANLAGEHITGLDGHPPLNIHDITETNKHDIIDILKESLDHEQKAIDAYYLLLKEVEGSSIYLEEYCRTMISQEENDFIEMKKLLRDHSA